MSDDPPSGDCGHDLIRVSNALSAAIAQRKGNGVGEVARLGRREAVGRVGHAVDDSSEAKTEQEP